MEDVKDLPNIHTQIISVLNRMTDNFMNWAIIIITGNFIIFRYYKKEIKAKKKYEFCLMFSVTILVISIVSGSFIYSYLLALLENELLPTTKYVWLRIFAYVQFIAFFVGFISFMLLCISLLEETKGNKL
ncbi:MAG: hypothetical protein V6Z89_03150 [Desulfobacter sp.]